MKVVVIKDLSIWVAQCGHGREALKISRSASKITFPVLSILRLKTLPNSIFPHKGQKAGQSNLGSYLQSDGSQRISYLGICVWFLSWRTSLVWTLPLGRSGLTGEE